MRHQKRGRKFGRVKKVRLALKRSLLSALILKERIRTTEAKAKELRPQIEKLVTLAKRADFNSRRLALRRLPDAAAVIKLMRDLAPKYSERKGGYVRITKLGPRKSDNARMAIIEFV